jgi:hypothetical protein
MKNSKTQDKSFSQDNSECVCECVSVCYRSFSYFLSSIFYTLRTLSYILKPTNNTQTLHNTHTYTHTQGVIVHG